MSKLSRRSAAGLLVLVGGVAGIVVACTGDTVVAPGLDASVDSGGGDVKVDSTTDTGIPDTGVDVGIDVGIYGTGKFPTESYLPLTAADGGPTSAAYGIAAADLNGDKHVDLVISGGASNAVLVYLGKGNGTFDAPVSYAAGTNPYYIAIADFNADQKPDLAVANNGASNNVSVLLGNGNGTFQAPASYATGPNTVFVIAADVSGDGIKDLIATELGGKVDVFVGAANGTFAAAVPFVVPSPWNVLAADLSGDGKLDLVVGTSSGNVYVLVNNGTNTLFGAPVAYPTDPAEAGVTSGAYAPLVGDYNGDNAREIAVAKCTGQNSLVFLPAPGNGTLGAVAPGTVTPFPNAACLYDMTQGLLDPDGIPDLVMGGRAVYVRSSSLLDGGAEASIAAYTPDAGDAAAPLVKTIVTADLNEDGVQDIAALVGARPFAFILFGQKK